MDPTKTPIRLDAGVESLKPELALRSLQLCLEASNRRSHPEHEFLRPLERHLRDLEQTAASFLTAFLTSSPQGITRYPVMGSLALQPDFPEPIPGPWLNRTEAADTEVLQ